MMNSKQCVFKIKGQPETQRTQVSKSAERSTVYGNRDENGTESHIIRRNRAITFNQMTDFTYFKTHHFFIYHYPL